MPRDSLSTLVRVRRIRERQAEIEWAAARAAEEEQQRLAEATQQRVRDSLDHQNIHSGEDLARGHIFALHLEVGVRSDLCALEMKRRALRESRGRADAARLSRRAVEAVHEENQVRTAVAEEKPRAQALDELGISAWWRRRSS